MKNKYLSFTKNITLATTLSMLGGIEISRLVNNFTENGKIIGAISTISEFILSYAAFLPLQAQDNRDVYKTTNGEFDKKQFTIDNAKFAGSFLGLDVLYVVTRPFVQDYLIKKGFDAGSASALTDSMYIPAYAVAAFALAKLTGVLKSSKKSLEDSL